MTIFNSASSSFSSTSCTSYTLPWGGVVTSSGDYSHTYSTVHACDSIVTAHVTIKNASSSSNDSTICSTALPFTWNSHVFTASGSFTAHISNAVGCDSAITMNVTAVVCNSFAHVTFNIQGYYDAGIHSMSSVALAQGMSSDATEVDSVTIELHNETTGALEASANGMLHTDGQVTVTIPPVSGNYWIAIKYKNAVTTWSSSAVAFTAGGTTNYSFASGSGQAYGDNMTEVESGVWAIYSGELGGDSNIDGTDYGIWEDSYYNFDGGYVATDLNGDGNVDGSDYSIWEANYYNFVSGVSPF